jgi:hypothetical protein
MGRPTQALDEARLDIRQPHMVRSLDGVDLDVMAASIVAAPVRAFRLR